MGFYINYDDKHGFYLTALFHFQLKFFNNDSYFLKYNLNKIQFDIINQNSETIDVIPNVTKILSDKTGTITKNELELTNIVFSNDKFIQC